MSYILLREAYIANTRNHTSGTSGDSDKCNSFIHIQGRVGDASNDANAHTARGTGQYAQPGVRRHAGHHTTPSTVHHTYIYSSCPRKDCEGNSFCSSNLLPRKLKFINLFVRELPVQCFLLSPPEFYM